MNVCKKYGSRVIMQRFLGNLHLHSRESQASQHHAVAGTKDMRVPNLIELCKQGDRAAQKSLFDTLAPKMFSVCLRYMGDRAAAEDVLQDGFITLFTKLDTYSGEGPFEGWARKIFVNTALMSLRKTDALSLSDDIDIARGVGDGVPTPVQSLGYKELMKLIAQLPTGFRTVFNLYVLEGYSHKEIAEALGISENTSRSQLRRARMMLQDRIKKE